MSTDLTDVGTIKNILRKYGLAPQRRFGQNFLIDRETLDKIVAAADLKPSDVVLEIGPGLGVLTRELCARAKKVLAVELDKTMVEILKETTADCRNLEIIHGDILKITNQEICEILLNKKTLNAKPYTLNPDFKIVANLPYNITSAVLRKFLSQELKPKEMILLVQKEVAERIIARPGEMSLLAVSVQFYGRPEIVGFVSKKSFWPEPEVDSAILKIVISDEWRVRSGERRVGNGLSEKDFFRIVKMGFSARRKQLQNNLSTGLKIDNQKIKEVLQKIGLNPQTRAQDLGPEDWRKLAGELKNYES